MVAVIPQKAKFLKLQLVLQMFYQTEIKNAAFVMNTAFASDFKVIRLGLEPRTPSLKGMCSTC